jgi:hypothetical protein
MLQNYKLVNTHYLDKITYYLVDGRDETRLNMTKRMIDIQRGRMQMANELDRMKAFH